jgi:hypothetical protein
MEHVVEIGVLGYVYGEFGDTFATAVHTVVVITVMTHLFVLAVLSWV